MDAYAWIEYLEGSNQGKKVRQILFDQNDILTHAVTVAEVVSRVKRKGFDGEAAFKAIEGISKIISADSDFCRRVGLLHAEIRSKVPGFGLADAFVLQLARDIQGRIVTGDPHFRGERNILFLE